MTAEERACFETLLSQAPPGTRIEFGVFRGATLALMAQHDGETIGVDSFAGMPPPKERDIKGGWNPYPAGRLAVSKRKVETKHRDKGNIRLIQGWVPDVLISLSDGPYAFAHVDLDHYDSTLAALRWLATRMKPDGIICCDDYIATRDWLAAGAINEFAKENPIVGSVGKKAWFVF